MYLDEGFKIKIRMMVSKEKYELAIVELRKIHIGKIDKLESDMDKYFVLYNLARVYYDTEKFKMSNLYLDELDNMITENNIKELQVAYHNSLWLRVKLNYKEWGMDKTISTMIKVYNYYDSLGIKDTAMNALASVCFFEKDSDKILFTLRELLKCPIISDWNFVTSILKECEEIDHALYIKAINIVNEYNPMFDIDIV